MEAALTLFDAVGAVEGATEPSMAEIAAAANAEKLTVIYVAYVANADSDEVLGAWWGTPDSLEEDGTMSWSPERLDMGIATMQTTNDSPGDLRSAGADTPTPGFAEGEVPSLDVTARPAPVQRPSAEQEPDHSEAEDGNE